MDVLGLPYLENVDLSQFVWPDAPSAGHREALVAERAQLVWSCGWEHSDYVAHMTNLRLEQARARAVTWRGNVYEKLVFKEVDRRADADAWQAARGIAGCCVLTDRGILRDLDEILHVGSRPVGSTPDVLRIGLDNTGLPAALGLGKYLDYALETMSATTVSGPRTHKIALLGAALGGETGTRMTGLVANSGIWEIASRLNVRCIVTGDCHGVEVLSSRENVVDDECVFCGLPVSTDPADARLANPPGRLPENEVLRGALLGAWQGDADLVRFAVRPGWWHSCSTIIYWAARADRKWDELHQFLDGYTNAVMNGRVSITGIEVMSAGLPADNPLHQWCSNIGVYDLIRATHADKAFEAVRGLHEFIIARDQALWTRGCHALYCILASCRVLFGGSIDPLREKPVERANQIVKREVPLSRHSLVRALGRARDGQRAHPAASLQ